MANSKNPYEDARFHNVCQGECSPCVAKYEKIVEHTLYRFLLFIEQMTWFVWNEIGEVRSESQRTFLLRRGDPLDAVSGLHAAREVETWRRGIADQRFVQRRRRCI